MTVHPNYIAKISVSSRKWTGATHRLARIVLYMVWQTAWPSWSVERRLSQVLSMSSTDDCRQFITLGIHLSRTKLTTCRDDRRVVQNF